MTHKYCIYNTNTRESYDFVSSESLNIIIGKEFRVYDNDGGTIIRGVVSEIFTNAIMNKTTPPLKDNTIHHLYYLVSVN